MTIIWLVHDCGIIYDLQCQTNVWLLYYEHSQEHLKKWDFVKHPLIGDFLMTNVQLHYLLRVT